MPNQELKTAFQEKLNLFCFFHLGSDARVEVREGDGELVVRVEHHRVESFQFAVTYPRLKELLGDLVALERYLLEEVTPHRK